MGEIFLFSGFPIPELVVVFLKIDDCNNKISTIKFEAQIQITDFKKGKIIHLIQWPLLLLSIS